MTDVLSSYSLAKLWLPLSGANNGTVFTDYSLSPKTITTVGNSKTVTSNFKFYDSSAYFDGAGDCIRASNAELAFGTEDFTIEFWAYFINGGHGQTNARLAATGMSGVSGGFSLVCANDENPTRLAFQGSLSTDFNNLTASTIPNDEWVHIAVYRISGVVYLAVNGTIQINAASIPFDFVDSNLSIGANNAGTESFNGYIQDFRVHKGLSLYDANPFTPPTKIISSISGVVRPPVGDQLNHEVIIFPRCWPTKTWNTTSSAVDGTFLFSNIPSTEYCRVVLNRGSTPKNDIMSRIVVQ